jgi:transposase InsO family protein
MGMVNYLSRFSRNLAELGEPIYAVIGKRSEWFWGRDQEKAFKLIKAELSSSPVLCAFDLNKKHRVSADASKTSIGAVLLQLNRNNQWQPVEYASRKLTEAEQRYAMIEKESLAITWACEKFDYYLIGRSFEIETDHKPLISLLGEKDLSKLPLRVQRFKLRLMRYDYSIFHTPGSLMFLADSLSRPNGADMPPSRIERSDSVIRFVSSNLLASEDIREIELIEALDEDRAYKQSITFIRYGWPKSGRDLSGEILNLYHNRSKLTLCSDFLMYGTRFYIPYNLRDIYLSRLHEGHLGINKCQSKAQQLFWWPGINAEIASFIQECNECIKNGRVKHQPWTEPPLPEGPWQEIGVDVFEFKNKLYTIMVDYYSKWTDAIHIRTQTTESVIEAMTRTFAYFGVPNLVRSDNGPCFASEKFKRFAESFGFEHRTSSPRYPQSNGLVERAVCTIKSMWYKCDDKSRALLAFRSSPLVYTEYSPGDLMLGRPIRCPLGLQGNRDSINYAEYERDANDYKASKKAVWDRNHKVQRLPELIPGQRVWVKTQAEDGFEAVVEGKAENPESYWVNKGSRWIRRNRKHLFLLSDPDRGNCGGSSVLPLAFERGENKNDTSETNEARVSSSVDTSMESDFGLRELFADPTNTVNTSVEPNLVRGDAAGAPAAIQPTIPHPYITRSGRAVKPRRDTSFVYY